MFVLLPMPDLKHVKGFSVVLYETSTTQIPLELGFSLEIVEMKERETQGARTWVCISICKKVTEPRCSDRDNSQQPLTLVSEQQEMYGAPSFLVF